VIQPRGGVVPPGAAVRTPAATAARARQGAAVSRANSSETPLRIRVADGIQRLLTPGGLDGLSPLLGIGAMTHFIERSKRVGFGF
jgi:hypothetical protein